MSNGISIKGIVDANLAVRHFDHEYLDNNPTIPAIDTGLSTSGAAADAAVVGQALENITGSIPEIDTTLSEQGKAADAKATGDMIAILKEDLISGPSVVMTDGSYISTNGTTATDAGSACTDFVPVIGGLRVKLSGVYLTGVRSVCLYDATQAYVSTQISGVADTEVEFLIPYGVAYIRATAKVNEAVTVAYTAVAYTGADNDNARRDELRSLSVLLPSFGKQTNTPSAICSHSTGRAWGFGFVRDYDVIAFRPKFVNSNVEEVNEGTFIIERCKQANGAITEVVYSEAHAIGDTIYLADVKTDDFFIIKYTFSNGSRVFFGYTATARTSFTTTLGYIIGDTLGASITSISVGCVSGDLFDVSPVWNKWHGKNVMFLGDSITDMGVYTEPLAYMLGAANAYNRGVSGNTVADIGTGTSFCERLELPASDAATHTAGMPTSADLVIVLGGVNDWGKRLSSNEELGVVTDAPNTTTFCGAYKHVLETLKEKYPKARIISVIPYRLYSDYMPAFSEMRYTDDDEQKAMRFVNYNGGTFDAYRDAIETIASYYGVPTIDLRGCGFSFFRSADRQLYAKETDMTGSPKYDGIHPNADGGFLIAKYIFDRIIAM